MESMETYSRAKNVRTRDSNKGAKYKNTSWYWTSIFANGRKKMSWKFEWFGTFIVHDKLHSELRKDTVKEENLSVYDVMCVCDLKWLALVLL